MLLLFLTLGGLNLALTSLLDRFFLALYASLGFVLMNLLRMGISVLSVCGLF